MILLLSLDSFLNKKKDEYVKFWEGFMLKFLDFCERWSEVNEAWRALDKKFEG